MHLVCGMRLIHERQKKKKKHGRDSRQSSLKIGRQAGKRSHGHRCREREEARRRYRIQKSPGRKRKADSTMEIREFRSGRINSVNVTLARSQFFNSICRTEEESGYRSPFGKNERIEYNYIYDAVLELYRGDKGCPELVLRFRPRFTLKFSLAALSGRPLRIACYSSDRS